MSEWLNNIAGPQYASAVMWTVGALILLVIVLFLVRIVKGVSSGTFVAGGRNRRARLAVMDAAAVDNQRRLVLVRRDNVEHLLLIGGPTDVVVEQNITPGTTLRALPAHGEDDLPNGRDPRPAPQTEAQAPEPPRPALRERQEPIVAAEPPAAAERPAPAAPEPAPAKTERPEPVLTTEPVVAVAAPVFAAAELSPANAEPPEPPAPAEREAPRAAEPAPERPEAERQEAATALSPNVAAGSVHFLDKSRIGAAPRSVGPAAPVVVAEPAATEVEAPTIPMTQPGTVSPRTVRREPRAADLDTALREELKAPLVGTTEQPQTAESSLEEEMKRLLGELSAPARN